MDKYNTCVCSLIAVSFISTAIIPNLLGYPLFEEINRFYCLAASSFITTILTLAYKKNELAPIVFLYIFVLSIILILLFILFQVPWLYYVKCLSCFCLFVSFYYAGNGIRKQIYILMPIISSFVCIFFLLVKTNLFNNHLQESLWFDNIAGPMLIISIGYTFLISHINHNKTSIRLSIIIVALLHVVVTIMSQSRTAIITITITSIILWANVIKKHNEKKVIIFFYCVILISFAFFLFLLIKKSGSTCGRLLIWKITLSASFNNFFLGNGPGSFLSKYMLCQAEFLQNFSNPHYTSLAGNIYHPFNEFLLILFQYGFIGVLFVTTVIANIFYKIIKMRSITLLCAIALFIFSFFSYPSKYAYFWVVLLFVISDPQLYTYRKVHTHSRYFVNIIVFLSSIALLCITISDISFNILWRKYYKEYILGNNESLNKYTQLAKHWNHDPCFLYNWAIVNYNQFDYNKCVYILDKCSIKLHDYYVEMLYGECFEHLESYNDALKHFKTCMNMCPSLLMPEYKTFEVYVLSKDNDNAIRVGEHIINRQLKVENATTKVIKENITDFLNQSSL